MSAAHGDSLAKDLTPEQFLRFRDWIHHHAGIYLEESKADSLRISLVTRATRFSLPSLDDYYQLLCKDDAEFKALMNLVTINETSFFRFPAQFKALQEHVIPEILEAKPKVSRQFRVWSAGCSTGEEPYTVAMALLDSGLEGLGYRPEVFGTDVSTAALDKARAGVYPAKSVANLEPDIVSRYFSQVRGGVKVCKRVQDLVEFSYHNLIKEPYPLALMGNWDVIFCRNVTIYFRIESTRRVVQNFYDSLNPGGYLFIGHSETLTNISDAFEPIEIDGVFLYRKPPPRKYPTFQEVVERRRSSGERGKTSERSVPSKRSDALRRDRRPVAPRATAEAAAATESAAAEQSTVPDLIARARRSLESGDPRGALAAIDQALAADPRSVDAHLIAAFAHADTGDLDAAIENANAVIRIDPLVPGARYILGIIYQRKGDSDRALAEFKRTVYIDRDFALAHVSMANIHRSRGEWDAAKRAYENALRALRTAPDGAWTEFLGGFTPELLASTCERGLSECVKTRRTG